MSVANFVKQIREGEIDVIKHINRVLDEIKKINKEYNYFNVICEKEALEQAKEVAKNPTGRLAGVPVSVKDCICVKGVESRAGSKILSGYKPVFNATAVERLRKEGAIIIGKTAQDEFGFGSFNVNVGVGFKIPLNPFDKSRVCGGSSGGSAGISARVDFPHISLAESTGGSIACPASFCGVAGLTPTYGRVSRYGLLDYANSLDKIGAIGRTTADAALMMEVISGFDENESTSLDEPIDDYSKYAGDDVSGMKIGVIKEGAGKSKISGTTERGFGEGVDETVEKHVKDAISKLESANVEVEEVSLPVTSKYGLSAYYLIATSEASTNLAKYCGMKYGASDKLEGNFNEYFSKVRSANFGDEAKRRIMLGTFARMAGYRDAYYIKAASVRTKIISEYKLLFKKYDALVCPTMPVIAPKIKDIEKLSPLQNYMMDVLTVGPNLAGLPHLNVTVGFEKAMPVGMMLIGDHLQEKKIIQLGSNAEVIK